MSRRAKGVRSEFVPPQTDIADSIRTPALLFPIKDLSEGIHKPGLPVSFAHVVLAGKEVQIDSWSCLNHLDEAIRIWVGEDSWRFRLPGSAYVVSALEQVRQDALTQLRALFADPQTQMRRLQAFPSDPLQQQVASELLGHLLMVTLFTTWLRGRYNLVPAAELGWKRGAWVECNLLLAGVPPIDSWGPESRRLWKQFQFMTEKDDVGGFALPTHRTSHASLSEAGEVEVQERNRIDMQRLYFYFTLPQYRSMRALDGANPYAYVAVLLQDDRMILDTANYGNRLFGLRGSLATCLELAQARKAQIAESELCSLRLIHGPAGNWQQRVREWAALK